MAWHPPGRPPRLPSPCSPPRCKPCQALKPQFKELRAEYDNLMFAAVDADEGKTVVGACGVAAYPTFQVYRGNVKVDEMTGASMEDLRAMLRRHSGR